MTYDGQYFYGGYEGINQIAVLDLANKKLVGTINLDRSVRHIAYIPTLDNGKGGFEIGEMGTSSFIDMKGNVLKDTAMWFHLAEDSTYTNSPDMRVYGTVYHDGKIYAHCDLGVMDLSAYPIVYNGPYSSIIEYDVQTGRTTARRFVLNHHKEELGIQGWEHACGLGLLEFPKGVFNLLLGFGSFGQEFGPLVKLELESELPENLSGYNLYQDNVKINATLIDKNVHSYHIGGLAQGEDVAFAIKAVYGTQESEATHLNVNLSDSRLLPFMEDFNSLSLSTNYWRVEDTASVPGKYSPWSVSTQSGGSPVAPDIYLMKYSGALNPTFSSMVYSKELNLKENSHVLLRFESAQTVSWNNPPFCDTLFLEINTGNGWEVVFQDTTAANGYALRYTTLDISDMAAGKSSVRFRFRVDGNSYEKNSYGYGYSWFIDNFKVWEPTYSSASGKVLFNGEAVKNVSVSLAKEADILVYSATTDALGEFAIESLEVGQYRLLASRADYNPYQEKVTITEGDNLLSVNLLQPAFSTRTTQLEISMRPNETLRSGFALSNSGTGNMAWRAGFEFPQNNQKATSLRENFPVEETFTARGNVEKSYAYLNDTIYSCYRPNYTSPYKLLRTLKDGTALDEPTTDLPFTGYAVPYVFSDDEHLYLTQNKKIYFFDVRSNQVTDSIETELSANISYGAWNPAEQSLLVGNTQELHAYSKTGEKLHEYSVSGLNIKHIAVDPHSHATPVLWVARSYARAEGAGASEYIGVFEYALDSSKLTGRYFLANHHPAYTVPTGYQQTDIDAMFGSSDAVAGRYVVFVATSNTQRGQATGPNLCAFYDIAASVKWIGMDVRKGALDAGETTNFYLNFSTEELKDGDVKTCHVILTSDIGIEPYVLPVRLTVDEDYETPCVAPSSITAHTEGATVSLSWRVETTGGALITENLEGFLVRRNGVMLTDTMIKQQNFVDLDPVIGKNVYEIQALYRLNDETECSSNWAASDAVTVSYTGSCATVAGMRTETERQRHILLTWDYPVNEIVGGSIVENCESLEAFSASESIGNGWTTLDLDRAVTYGINNVEFPHNGEAMPFIVFNPYETQPASSGMLGAYSGRQMLASFCPRLEGVANNDWLISPLVESSQTALVFSFMAQTPYIHYGSEEIRVAYSTTGKEVSDFIFFDEQPILVPREWTEYNYVLPKGTRYVAINCVSNAKFLLLVDDIYIGPNRSKMRLDSYAVYKNEQLLQEISPRAVGFFDFALLDGEYNYSLEARYNNGCVSAKSDPVHVKIDFKHGITPARALTASVNEKDESIQLKWQEPAWGDPEEIIQHNGLLAGFSLADGNGEPGMFFAGSKIDISDPTLMDYSISALRIGFFEACKAKAFVIDMTSGVYVAEQTVKQVNENGFTIVEFDEPVKVEYGKSYLIGYEVVDYSKSTFPAGTDFGPGINGGAFISVDGFNWASVYDVFQEDFNWTIDAILEVIDNPMKTAQTSNASAEVTFGNTQNHSVMLRKKADYPVVYKPISPNIPKGTEPEVAIEGYTVMRDQNALFDTPIQELHYTDTEILSGNTYKYAVKTHYANGENAATEEISVFYQTVSNENGLNGKIAVYVNGSSIFVKNQLGAACDITIRNLTGMMIKKRNNCPEGVIEIPMNTAPQGMYLVCIRFKDNLFVQKVVL